MPYTSISAETSWPTRVYVDLNWTGSGEALKKQIYSRGANLALAPTLFMTGAVDAIIGVGAGIATVCTLGMCRPVSKLAFDHLATTRYLMALPYQSLLHVINPNAQFPKRTSILDEGNGKGPWIGSEGNGFVHDSIHDSLRRSAEKRYESENFLHRQVTSRLTYALLAIASVITRVTDAIIGLRAAVFSMLTLGKVDSLNNVAYRALQAPAVIHDLFYCAVKFLNPAAFLDSSFFAT